MFNHHLFWSGVPEELSRQLIDYLKPMMLVEPAIQVIQPGKDLNEKTLPEIKNLLGLKESISDKWRAAILIPTHSYYDPIDAQDLLETIKTEFPSESKKHNTFFEDILIVNIEFNDDLYLTEECKHNVRAALSEQGVYFYKV